MICDNTYWFRQHQLDLFPETQQKACEDCDAAWAEVNEDYCRRCLLKHAEERLHD